MNGRSGDSCVSQPVVVMYAELRPQLWSAESEWCVIHLVPGGLALLLQFEPSGKLLCSGSVGG